MKGSCSLWRQCINCELRRLGVLTFHGETCGHIETLLTKLTGIRSHVVYWFGVSLMVAIGMFLTKHTAIKLYIVHTRVIVLIF